MRKCFIILVCVLTFAATAQAGAGRGNLCHDSTVQTGTGQAFASKKECQKAAEVFAPALTIAPTHVSAGERFTLTGSGFHASSSVVVSFAITGQAAYATYTPPTSTLADGSYSLPFVFAACRKTDAGADVPVDLTLTLTDSSGVHAAARLALC